MSKNVNQSNISATSNITFFMTWQCSQYTKTSQAICFANQLTGFFIREHCNEKGQTEYKTIKKWVGRLQDFCLDVKLVQKRYLLTY